MGGQFSVKTLELDMGLPPLEDLTPLNQSLITPELAFAFGIAQERPRVRLDLNRVSQDTCSTKCPREENSESIRLFSGMSESDRSGGPEDSSSGSKDESRGVKRPRLVWTPQLHKRFVDVIEHLGIFKAVPKTIMEMMNVEGLTRENVASHLQKYRLYLKRMEGFSNEGHSVPRMTPTLLERNGFSSMIPMPMVGRPSGPYGFGHSGTHVAHSAPPGYCGLESTNMMWNRYRG